MSTLEMLDLIGVPLFVLRPGGPIKGQYSAPRGWQNLTAEGNDARLAAAVPGSGFGMVCGHLYDVIDIDPRNGGLASLKMLAAQGLIPRAHQVIATPSGGWHLYISPLSVGKHTPFPGIDLQAAGSFVFVPPTADYRELPPEEWPELGERLDDAAARLGALALSDAPVEPEALSPVMPTSPLRSIPEDVVRERVIQTLQSLDALAGLPEGERLPWPNTPGGVGWDVGGLYAAERLVQAANSGTGYTLDQARADFIEHSPSGGTYDPTHKWDEAVKYVGDKPLPYAEPRDDFDRVAGPDDTPQDGENASGWLPVDLSPYMDGTHASPAATLMHRTDGVGLLYPGMTHSIHGESESGKSMIVQAEVASQLKASSRVLYLDYEGDPGSMVERLRLMGVSDEQMLALVYVQPEADYGRSPVTREVFEELLSRPYALAVIDGVTEALAQAPAKLRSTGGLGGNDDITVWHDHLPRVIARRTVAAVVLVDHVAKGPDAGRFALGGQAKMATMTGAAYLVKVISPLGRDLIGEVDMYVAKDRHGYIRSKAVGEFTKDRLQLVATAMVDGTNGCLSVELRTPPATSGADEKLHFMMERVSNYLRTLPEGHSGAGVNLIKKEVQGNHDLIARALKTLVGLGYVGKTIHGQQSLHHNVRPFIPGFDQQADEEA